MTSVLKDAEIGAGRVQLFDDALIITTCRATMEAGYFPGNAVGPLQVLDKIICKSPYVARRFRERRADVDG